MRPLNRTPRAAPPQAYKEYRIDTPIQSHYKTIGCMEAGCQKMANGWTTVVDDDSELAYFIRYLSGRSFTESKTPKGQTKFKFGPGQTCFGTHRDRLDRPEFFSKIKGDHRQRFGERYFHTSGSYWVEDFAENQARIIRQIEKG